MVVRLPDISSKMAQTHKKCIFCLFLSLWMGLNFQYYDGLQPNIRAGIINEHECTLYSRLNVYTRLFGSIEYLCNDSEATF